MQGKPTMAEVAAAFPQIRLEAEIGEGGFKIVYRAEVHGHVEAFKLARIPEDPADPTVGENNRRRLSRELDLLMTCETPCLVRLGAFTPVECRIGPYQYVGYSEELVPGECLRSRIRAGHRPSQAELATLAACLLSAVRELAAKNAIHRDIKPDNVMATGDAARPFVLLDLGVAFIVGGGKPCFHWFQQPQTDSRTMPDTTPNLTGKRRCFSRGKQSVI